MTRNWSDSETVAVSLWLVEMSISANGKIRSKDVTCSLRQKFGSASYRAVSEVQ